MRFNNRKRCYLVRSVYRPGEQSAYQSREQASHRKGRPWPSQKDRAMVHAVNMFSSSRGLNQTHWIRHLQGFIQQSHLISQLSMPVT